MFRRLGHFWRYWLHPVFSLSQLFKAPGLYWRYLSDWSHYQKLAGAEKAGFVDSYPRLFDRTSNTPYSAHYLYQGIWAAERIMRIEKHFHVDVGSEVAFASLISVMTPVIFLDLRPLQVSSHKFASIAGDLLQLPFASGSIQSLSSLHVVEHVGLGRYGDALDPLGTRRACGELERVLAPGGNLFLSLPVGRPRLQFNAHRIHAPITVREFFSSLELVEFSAVDDRGNFLENVPLETVSQSVYACGMYWLVKPIRH